MSERENSEISLKDNEQRGNAILRQELKNLTPVFNVKFAIICNAFLSFLFFIFGIPIIASKAKIVEFSLDYTTKCETKSCNFPITIEKLIPSPVYVYYELTNFYANHRDYVKSKIWSQLRGETHIDSRNNTRCEGAKLMREMMDGDSSRYKTYSGLSLNGNDYANPCGLAAKAFFNDSYILTDKNEKNFDIIEIKSNRIANEYDKKYVFKKFNDSEKVQWINVEDERFIVWMQMETFPNFRKLWGRIESNLLGEYNLEIINNYNAKSFNGTKKIVFSNSTSLGNSSSIGYFLVMGGIFCILVIIILLILNSSKNDTEIDFTEIKWE